MRTILTLSLPILLVTAAVAQCPTAIPSYAQVIDVPGVIATEDFMNFWLCGGADLHNEGSHCVYFMEEGAVLYLVGDSNAIFTKGENYIYLNPGADYNLVFHEGTGSLIANNGTYNSLIPCSDVVFDYSNAPAGGCVEAGVADTQASAGLLVFPTIVTDLLTVRTDGPAVNELWVTDMAGHEVMRIQEPHITSADLSRLNAGNYVVHLLTANGEATRQVMKR